ncbi:MAG: hypothetical protein R2684_13545 [Pyrinomonadaceae bacterium]
MLTQFAFVLMALPGFVLCQVKTNDGTNCEDTGSVTPFVVLEKALESDLKGLNVQTTREGVWLALSNNSRESISVNTIGASLEPKVVKVKGAHRVVFSIATPTPGMDNQ